MKENKHSKSIPRATLLLAQEKLAEVKDMLSQYTTTLTPAERHKMAKMGPKTVDFVMKAYEYAIQNPNLVPPYLLIADLEVDFTDALGLNLLHSQARQLENSISDTKMVASSEVYQSILIFYSSLKVAAANNVNGAETLYDELKKCFPSRGKSKKSEPAE